MPARKKPRRAKRKKTVEERIQEMASNALDKFEQDPEAALRDLKNIGVAAGKVVEHAYKNPEQAKRVLKNAALKGVARVLKGEL